MVNQKKRSGLGRGMDALFSNIDETPREEDIISLLNVDDIRSNPYQPRKTFDETALQELADSIKQSGVFQPVIVRRSAVKGYELIAGERRVRASRLAGKKEIPAIIRQLDEHQMIEIAILENLQREDLSTMEEAEAYQLMMEKLNLTQNEVAERMGKSRPYIANYLRLLSLPEKIKVWVNEGKLSMGQARTLLAIKDKGQMLAVAERVIKENLTVRQLEEIVNQVNQKLKVTPPSKQPSKPVKPAHIRELENKMQEHFGTSAIITQKGDRGKIEIEFLSDADFIRIIDLLNIQL